ncbi:MAG: DUF3597 domain-containing protein [Mesorhizobium sp.]
MGIFDKIKNAIWGGGEDEAAAPTVADTSSKPVVASAAPAPSSATPSAAPKAGATSPTPAAAPVDVAAILDAAVKRSGQKLDWRKSIVDLMKALGLDSSLAARKELAAELGYTGSTSDSAAMNMWLHKQVIQKLRDNGGKVPADLL